MKSYYTNDGFISTYFLAFLLCLSSLCAIVLYNDIEDLQTCDNMNLANRYYRQEMIVINDIKCRLLNDALEEFVMIDNITYQLEENLNMIYVTIQTDDWEMLEISYDAEEKKILSFTAIRQLS